jgi:hypothetical protein
MKKVILASIAAVAIFAAITSNVIGAAPTVLSYAAPALVSEINTGFTAVTPYYSTATNTVITQYTPRTVGDLLVGRAGVGTNVLYVAVGTTTNDWKKVTITN